MPNSPLIHKCVNCFEQNQVLLSGYWFILMEDTNCDKRLKYFNDSEKDRIVEMAWEDRTTFDVIRAQFGISQGEVEKLMRKELKSSSFKRWRKRVSSGVGVKHEYKADPDMLRFKCSRQKSVSMNKVSKR